MPVFSTPEWDAPQAGIIGDAAATAGSAQIDQFLGTHPSGLIFQGNSILTPNGAGASAWAEQFSTLDIDQPFTMSGTAVGRVAIPLLAVGDGADLLVSLCADNAGTPGAMITQTRIPANWISQLAAVSGAPGPSTQAPVTQYTGNPLATAQFNRFRMGVPSQVAWSFPTNAGGLTSLTSSQGYGANYFIILGGNTGSTMYTSAWTIAFDSAGNLAQAVPQPPLPVGSAFFPIIVATDPASGSNTVLYAGGQQVSGTANTQVFAAGFDPTTGTISSWSAQTALPVAVFNQELATANVGAASYVYSISGDINSSFATTPAVYYAQIQNGQITAWTATTPLPVGMDTFYAIATNGLLFVFGGESGASVLTSCYYAPVNANGSLGSWRTGPTLPVALDEFNVATIGISDYGLVGIGSSLMYTLSVGPAGPDIAWVTQSLPNGGVYLALGAGSQAGEFRYYGINVNGLQYETTAVNLTPTVSVPLPATGLTSGATYHILMQQQGGDLNDYLRTSTDVNVFPGDPTALTGGRDAYSWTAAPAGTAVPIQIFDQTAAVAGVMPWHSWEDNGAHVTTLVCATTPDRRLLGLCEATRMGLALNANQGFETGIAPWTPTNCAAVQSSTEVFEGQYAAKITPNGTSPSCSIASEILPCMPGQAVTAAGSFWFTNAVTSNFSLSVTWYPAVTGGSPISTTASLVSVGAGAWTAETGALTAPGGAYGFTIVPTLSGTPAAAQIWFADNVYATYANVGPQQSSVTLFNYPAAWPGQTWPPQSTVVLA